MQKVRCEHCKAEVPVMLYFYDERINTHTSSFDTCGQYYEAEVSGRSICPYCGAKVRTTFRKSITKEDIIDLAGGRGE
jgi:DNA-directed RNA polymerase subunit RPC12/RpoP